MQNAVKSSGKITYADAKSGRDVAKVSFFVFFMIITLYLLTIAVLPVYAR